MRRALALWLLRFGFVRRWADRRLRATEALDASATFTPEAVAAAMGWPVAVARRMLSVGVQEGDVYWHRPDVYSLARMPHGAEDGAEARDRTSRA